MQTVYPVSIEWVAKWSIACGFIVSSFVWQTVILTVSDTEWLMNIIPNMTDKNRVTFNFPFFFGVSCLRCNIEQSFLENPVTSNGCPVCDSCYNWSRSSRGSCLISVPLVGKSIYFCTPRHYMAVVWGTISSRLSWKIKSLLMDTYSSHAS